jgi:hypothetical protein
MPILGSFTGARSFGLGSSTPLGLYWLISNFGSGYGVRATSATGNFYAQNYGATRKLSKNGTHMWTKTLGAGNVEALGIDSSENVYVSGGGNMMIAKFDTNGTLQWQRKLSSNASDNGQDMYTTSAGVSYIVGARFSGSTSYACLSKVDASGNLSWSRYNTTGTTEGQAVTFNSAAQSVGMLAYYGGSPASTTLAVFDVNGNLSWQRRISPTDGNGLYGMGLTADSSGNYYASGMLGSTRHNWIVKFNSSGSVLWSKQYEIPGVYSYNDYGTVGVDSSDNLYLSFYQNYNNTDIANGLSYGTGFMKINPSNGSIIFTRQVKDVYGSLRIGVASDGTIGLSGVSIYAKLKGDGSGLGTYGSYTYLASTVLSAQTPSLSVSTDGFGYSDPGFSATNGSYTVGSATFSPTITYIGTEVG